MSVEHQVQLACLGVAQNVQNHQTQTGVKDGYTQYWIDRLIERARILRKEQPGKTADDIQSELLTWVEEHKSEIYNPFLKLDGEHSLVNFLVLYELDIQSEGSMLLLILRLNYFTPSFWAS